MGIIDLQIPLKQKCIPTACSPQGPWAPTTDIRPCEQYKDIWVLYSSGMRCCAQRLLNTMSLHQVLPVFCCIGCHWSFLLTALHRRWQAGPFNHQAEEKSSNTVCSLSLSLCHCKGLGTTQRDPVILDIHKYRNGWDHAQSQLSHLFAEIKSSLWMTLGQVSLNYGFGP